MSTPEDTVKGQPRKRRKITRSREGCLTCRRRRKLCSFDKPVCEACARLSLECTWPDTAEPGPSRAPSRAATPATVPLPAPDPASAPIDWFGSGGYEAVIGGLFEPEFQLDEATLQLWAAVSLAAPGAIDVSLQNGLTPPAIPLRSASPQLGPRLLEHFNTTLESLCTAPGPEARRSIETLTRLARPADSSRPAHALHLAILAWAGRHLFSQGEAQYEAPAEKAGSEASKLLAELLACFSPDWPVTERITLLAAVQMAIHYKISKGDAWGFSYYLGHAATLACTLFSSSNVPTPSSQLFYFFEHMIFLDAFSTAIVRHGSILDPEVVAAYCKIPPDTVMTWAGLAFPLHGAVHRTACLIRRRRSIPLATRPWSDCELLEILRAADELLREIGQSQATVHATIGSKPQLGPHQHLHDAYRLGAQLNIRTAVLCEAPSSLTVRLLVRQLLAVIEYMKAHSLPGAKMLHWPLFQAAVAARTGGQAVGRDDRERALAMYNTLISEDGSHVGVNISRSLKLVREVWARTDGSVYVDWVDILEQYDWELFMN